MDRKQLGADLGLLLVTAIWGATFVMVKEAVSEFPVFAFLTIRFSLALASLLPLLLWRQLRQSPSLSRFSVSRSTGIAGVVIGLALFSGYAFQTFGLRLTTPAKAGFITGLSVVMVPIFAALILRRAPRRSSIAGVVLATVGMTLMTLQGQLSILLGDLIILACAVSFAIHILAVGHYSPRMDTLSLVILQIATVAVLSLIASLIIEGPWPAIPAYVWEAAAFTGVAATTLAFGVQTIAQRFTTPTHTALIFTMEPVWAGLFSYWLIGEILGPRALAGGALILAGMLIAELAPALRALRNGRPARIWTIPSSVVTPSSIHDRGREKE